MPNSSARSNQLLARLPDHDYQHLLSHLQPVALKFKDILYEAGSSIEWAYFPSRGALSAVTLMEDGSSIEVATIGKEGMVGLPVLQEADFSPNRVIVQVAGDGVRIRAEALKTEVRRSEPLRRLLGRYHTAFFAQVSQSVACNGLHKVQQRCCRWLLLTHDRVGTDEMTLTNEFLGVMLGVRRSSVTDVLRPFQEQGFVRVRRGKIAVLNRAGLEAGSCECYRIVKDHFARLFD